jgi:hypothetical protein
MVGAGWAEGREGFVGRVGSAGLPAVPFVLGSWVVGVWVFRCVGDGGSTRDW